ncbi:MAG: hypothetical protein KAR42_17830, partial [candidate division Zixibacteria bacterium]|nr:hypothetical protein [candidate division Zixibacteria bacterium]
LSSTAGMDADCRGWYLNLLLHQYDKKSLPNDIETLGVMAGVKFSEFERFKQVFNQVLKHKFEVNKDGNLENPKANEVLRKRETFKDKRSRSGKIGQVIKKALKIKGFDKYINTLKSELYDKTDEEIEQITEHVLKQMLKLYINGNRNKDKSKTEVKKVDYIGSILSIWCDCFYENREFEYEITNEGHERTAISSLSAIYKKNNPKANTTEALGAFKLFFKMYLNIETEFIHNTASPIMLLKNYNQIYTILKNGTPKQSKHNPASDQDITRISHYFFSKAKD